MFRLSLLSRSTSLHDPNSPFVQASLQLMKLHLAHKNLVEKGDRAGASKEARVLEHEFKRGLDTFRAIFTLSQQTSAAKLYSGRIVNAMRHFGLEDDPLSRQIQRTMGRDAMRRQPSSATRNLFFKGVVANPQNARPSLFGPRGESNYPSELVGIAKTKEEDLPANAVKIPERHRGHWVLRDPDIAITRHGRRYDAW
jgi:hypothetical protein